MHLDVQKVNTLGSAVSIKDPSATSNTWELGEFLELIPYNCLQNHGPNSNKAMDPDKWGQPAKLIIFFLFKLISRFIEEVNGYNGTVSAIANILLNF